MEQAMAHRREDGAQMGSGAKRRSALSAAQVVAVAAIGVLVMAQGAAGIKCLTNNKNDVTVLPTNTSEAVECSSKHVCASILIMNPPSYFAKNCGPKFDQPCNCMLDCVPLWVTDGDGAWKDPLKPDQKGMARTKTCTSNLCNTACSAASALRRSWGLVVAAGVMAALAAGAF